MEDLFQKWRTRVPRYNAEYQGLFDALSNKGGGSAVKQVNLGKNFGNNYELYIYAFFLGLYQGVPEPTPEQGKRNDFGHPIQFWGNKGTVVGRKDYSSLQENLFVAAVAHTEIDLLALEKGELSEDDAIKELLRTMENYTNTGLNQIQEKAEDLPNHFLNPTAFLDLIAAAAKTDAAVG